MESNILNNPNSMETNVPYTIGTLLEVKDNPGLVAKVVSYEIYKGRLLVTLQRLTDYGYLYNIDIVEINAFWKKHEGELDNNIQLVLNRKKQF